MAQNPNTIYIAGSLNAANWSVARDTTQRDNTPEGWHSLFDTYFQQRLDRRYLNPIRTLQANDTYSGEGFTIAAIQCTLIEFLAASRKGKSYRYRQSETDQYYSNSSKLFIDFLAGERPFSAVFDAMSAEAFYKNVRCGLLHEARTKGGWTIWAHSGSDLLVDTKELVVYRSDMQKAILAYVARTRQEIATDVGLQAAFVRTFDSLCQP